MPDPVLSLDSARVVVAPGGQVSVPVTVTSTSSIVEGFQLDVVGSVAALWAEMVPPVVDVYPGEEAAAVVVFSPPATSQVSSGVFPFGVRARSTENPEDSAVVEGDVEVGQVLGLQTKLVPVTSTGRWRGHHTVQVTNSGNSDAVLRMVATDPDEALGFYLHPEMVELAAGQSTTVRMTVRTRRPFLRGAQVRLPFQIVGEPPDAAPGVSAAPADPLSRPVVDGALQQKPILTKPLVALVAVLLVAVLAGGIWAWNNPQGAASALEQLGPPEQPTRVVTTAVRDDRVRVSWAPIPQVTGYKVQAVDPSMSEADASDPSLLNATHEVASSHNEFVLAELAPATQYCFRVVAMRGSLSSPPSEIACATTAAKMAPEGRPGATKTPAPNSKAGIAAQQAAVKKAAAEAAKKATTAAEKKAAAEAAKKAGQSPPAAPAPVPPVVPVPVASVPVASVPPPATPTAPTTITSTVTPAPVTSTATATATQTTTATMTVAPPVKDTYIVAYEFAEPTVPPPSEGPMVGVQAVGDSTEVQIGQLMEALADPVVGLGNNRIRMDPPVFPRMKIDKKDVNDGIIAVVAVGPYAETDNAGIVAGCLKMQSPRMKELYLNGTQFSTLCHLALFDN
jgi:hypothetical protein